jgi:hypothetical protein
MMGSSTAEVCLVDAELSLRAAGVQLGEVLPLKCTLGNCDVTVLELPY